MAGLSNSELSIAEAAFVTGLPTRAIDHEVDARILRPRGRKHGRGISAEDAVYLRTVGHYRNALAPSLRKQMRKAIASAIERHEDVAKVGQLQIAIADVRADVLREMEWLDRVKAKLVDRQPSVMGGEPVLRGTRIPVRLIADLVGKGASTQEIAQELGVSREQIDAAVTFDRIVPPRGRPRLRRLEINGDVSADR